MKTKPTNQSVEEYIDSVPVSRREDMRALHELIAKTMPDAEVKMWSNIIGYGQYHYVYASGREGDWFTVGLANRAQYISLYICAGKDGQYLAEANKDRLGKVSVGRSCIRFKKLEDLNLDVVREIVKEANDLTNSPDGQMM